MPKLPKFPRIPKHGLPCMGARVKTFCKRACVILGETRSRRMLRGRIYSTRYPLYFADIIFPAKTPVKFLGYTKPNLCAVGAEQFRVFQFAGEKRIRNLRCSDVSRASLA